MYDLNLHKSLKSLREVAEDVCGEQQLDDLKRRITVISKITDSMFTLRDDIDSLLENSLLDSARDLLLLIREPDLSELFARSSELTSEVLNGLAALSGLPSIHLKSISGLVASAQEHREAVESLHLNLELLSRSNASFVQFQEELQELLSGMYQFPEQGFSPEPLNEVLKNLSTACEMKYHVDFAEKTFLNWQQTPQRFMSATESSSKVDFHLKQVANLRTTVAGVVQLMEARLVILSHLESFSLIFERADTFERRLLDLGVALSTVAPTKSLVNIEEDTTTLYRDLHAFYAESSSLMCDKTKPESDDCSPSDTNMMPQSAPLERERASLLQRLNTLQLSFVEGLAFSQAYDKILAPALASISHEASALSVAAHEAYEVALALKRDSPRSFAAALATSFCKNATGTSRTRPELQENRAILCASGQTNPVFVKEVIMQALHFVAIDVYTTLQYGRVVVDAVGKELILASQGPRTVSFTDFTSSLTQLSVGSLRSIWQSICTVADHLTRNSTCECIHDLMSYSLCAESTTLIDFIVSAYEADVVINNAGQQGTSLLVALDTFCLLARSNLEAEVETQVVLTGLSHLCQIAHNGMYHSQALHSARAAVHQVCWMQVVQVDQNITLYTSHDSFHLLVKQAATLWEDLHVIMEGSMDSIFDIASHDKKQSLFEEMDAHIQGTQAFAVALRSTQQRELHVNLHHLTVAESHIKAIMSQNFTPLYCSQYPTVDELSGFAIAADAAWASMNSSRRLLLEDLELLAGHGFGKSIEKQTTMPHDLPLACSSLLCIQMQPRVSPGRPSIFRQKYQEFSELIAHAYFNDEGTMLPKITAPGLYTEYSIRASTFFGSERLLMTLEPHGLKKLQGRASLVVLIKTNGQDASVEKIFELSAHENKFIPFQGSVDGVTVANELVWIGSANQGKLHSFAVKDVMASMSTAGPSRLNIQDSIDFQLRAGICPASVFFDPTTQRLWVGEYALPPFSDPNTLNPGLACGFQADTNGLVAVEALAVNKICLVIGEFVQGIVLFRKTGKQMVALSRCITQHMGSPCKVEFHRLDCSTQPLHPNQECLPHSSSPQGTPTWDLTGVENALGNSLQLAIRIPGGAKGLAFKAEDVIFGGNLLLCFASATKEAIDVYALSGDVEDSCYLFATPFTANDQPLQISRNEIYLTVMNSVVLNAPIYSSEMCLGAVVPIWRKTGPIFSWKYHIWITMTPLTVVFKIGANWGAGVDLDFHMCLGEFSVSAALVKSVRLEIFAEGTLSIGIFRGSIGVKATILNTRLIPAVTVNLFPSRTRGPPGIKYTTKLEIIPLALEIYILAEHIFCLKFCSGFPCGLKWCTLARLVLASWSMHAITIQGPRLQVTFPDTTPPIAGSVAAFQTSLSSINVEWLGFFEEESEIFSYFVCIGSVVDKSAFMPCLDLGLSTSFHGQNLQIPHESVAVVTIRLVSLSSPFPIVCMCVSDRWLQPQVLQHKWKTIYSKCRSCLGHNATSHANCSTR